MMSLGLTFVMGLIALSAGVALLIWSMRNEGAGIKLAKIFGYIITIISIILLVGISIIFLKTSYEMKMMHQECIMRDMQ